MATRKKGKASAAKGGGRAAKKRGKKGSASRPAARKTSRPAASARATARKPARRSLIRKAARKTTPAALAYAGRDMYAEGNWKADAEYREGLREFSETHDAERLARKAAEVLEPDLRNSQDQDVADSARRGAEEEPEW